MKRSEAIKLLMPKTISKFEILSQENYESGVYEQRAEDLLDFIENTLKLTTEWEKE